jgi:hypothetical protein
MEFEKWQNIELTEQRLERRGDVIGDWIKEFVSRRSEVWKKGKDQLRKELYEQE